MLHSRFSTSTSTTATRAPARVVTGSASRVPSGENAA
jgi:hypothetical protein